MSLDIKTSLIDRRALLVGAGFAICGGASYLSQPRHTSQPISDDDFQKLLPRKVGGWTARLSSELILPTTDALSDKLYENLKTFIYEGPDLPSIMFLIAYSSVQQNDVQVHRPEVCYPMSGYPILNNQPVEARIGNLEIPARFLVADRGAFSEMILYWTRVGKAFPLDWAQQRFEMARANVSGVVPNGALVRFSTISDAGDNQYEALVEFAKKMREYLLPQMDEVFFGTKT